MRKIRDISEFVPVITEQSMKKDISERFRLRRKEYGISQKELARRSGVSYESIRRFERDGDISLYSLLRISSIIGCLTDFNELFINPIVKDIRR